jgi:group I intron endonuclease
MNMSSAAVFATPFVDGVALLPKSPGVYGMLNRATRMWNIGQSKNMRQRCCQHRSGMKVGVADNMRVERDVKIHGVHTFFYCILEHVSVPGGDNLKDELNQRELWWVVQFQALDERYGYNLEAGGYRTLGARFRDRERKLMRRNSGKYCLLPWVEMYAPINMTMLASWVLGS